MTSPVVATTSATVARQLRVVLGQLVRRLREQSESADLTGSQKSVLRRLEQDGPASIATLARAEGIRPQSMSAGVAVLESIGMIDRAPDPADGRKVAVSLSEAARRQFASGRWAREDWLATSMSAQLSPGELATLAECIELLTRLAQAP